MPELMLIRGGTVVTSDEERLADVLICEGKVVEIGKSLKADGAEVLEAAGCLVTAGFVDLHTHLREPGREDAETVASGSRAAARGGYTALCPMANTDPVADSAAVVEQVLKLGEQAGLLT